MSRRTFVTGGSGLIGGALVARLVARGDDVVALARSDAAEAALRARGAEVVRGDLFDPDALARGMESCELAFHVAGINTMCPTDPAELLRVNIAGTVAVVRAAAGARLGRLVHTSSAAAVAEARGRVGRESTPFRGWYLSTYERSKHEGELAAQAEARRTGLDVVCVNPSSVQGPGRAGGTGRILLALVDGRLAVFIDTHISLVDLEDTVEGHLLAAERGQPGERYLLNGVTFTSQEALDMIERVTGARREPRMLPPGAARLIGAAVEAGARVAGRRPPLCREMTRTLLHGHRYDGSRAVRELGLTYTAAEDTLRRTVDWARGEGLLRAA